MPYKVIVVGTDGSERATIAVREALALAKVAGATLHAVHMIQPAAAVGFVDTTAGQLEVNRIRAEAEGVKAQLLAEAQGQEVAVEMHSPGGSDAAEAIISLAEAVDADLIVVGNRGMSGVTRFVLGSVPNKVSHNSPCSLLIVNTDRD